ncbi:hypothetical protein JANAI62_17810 [Jannaschia pagri]|uniref:Formate dehydrogenase region TAT target n=1 Tax=Jannaschia pagri TaxID=2829797 RepID=A0ABQ4NL68_9RHOB|nr:MULTISPECIES: twin-arginine translocation signal domain-containing protein [unclassified Jannaschia]GIT91325.1 hypothetical protein JANAI61_17830 [Jannaschia sp. AI_61]GIT95158.1 hypothetical protein JANAI62_17810 [Jannaschia sp. AI_62]
MTQKDTGADTSRRGFLKLAGTAAPVAAVAVATGSAADAAPAEPDLTSERMQDTAHTRAYFDSARF